MTIRSGRTALRRHTLASGVAWLCGTLEGLLLARLLLRLFAARPDNAAVQAVYALTEPLVAPLHMLNAGQPGYGAALELSTLLLLVVVPLVGFALWWGLLTLRGR